MKGSRHGDWGQGEEEGEVGAESGEDGERGPFQKEEAQVIEARRQNPYL